MDNEELETKLDYIMSKLELFNLISKELEVIKLKIEYLERESFNRNKEIYEIKRYISDK